MEHRRLLAFDLVQAFATADSPFFLAGTNYSPATVGESPQEISLRFSAGIRIDPTALASSITVVRSGRLGDAFANGNDIVVTPGYLGVDDLPNENRVIIRFAETLPNDSYRITLGASLKTLSAGPTDPVQMFRGGNAYDLRFNLDLGAQVTAVVPQPVIRPKTISFVAVPQEGDLLELGIRGGKRIFEFDGNGSVQPGNTALSITGKTTLDLAGDLAAAINALSGSPGLSGELGSASALEAVTTVSGLNFTPVLGFTRGGAVPPTSPVRIGDGAALTQLKSKVVVYFNAVDPLDAASVVPAAFKLFTLDAATGADTGTIVNPTAVSYDATSASAILEFATDLAADNLYRLQIGEAAITPKADVSETDNANSTFDAAKDLGSLSGAPLERVSVKVTGAIDPTVPITTPIAPLVYPSPTGDGTEPGHRDIPSEQHLGIAPTPPGQILVQYYNFNDYYGSDVQGNQLTNVITETQKQRAREIFDLYSRYTGIRFIESASQGITVITGDLRAFSPTLPREPLAGLGATGTFAAMDSADDWGESEYGGAWFQVAMHEIGHALGLGHAYDIPAIMGAMGRLGSEGVFPGNYDRVHLDHLFPRAGTDIDLYKFQLSTPGQLAAQTFIARSGQPVLSQLDSVLTLYREDVVGGKPVRTLVARNDDSFGRDSFVGIDLQAGTYYIAVTSTGNTNFNPEILDSGYGGRTDGAYELRVDFSPASSVTSPILDTTGTPLDGDRNGTPGGEYKFWFQTAANTLFVDKAAYTDLAAALAAGADGSLAKPFFLIQDAIAAATGGAIIRIIGNTGNSKSSLDDRAYLIGTDLYGRVLEDGDTFIVPKDVTVMIDAGATFKMRSANIDVGSSSSLVDRSGAVLQVLGTPAEKVFFTSFHDDARSGDSDRFGPAPQGGQWGGLVFRGDSDFKKDRVLGTLGTSQNNDTVFLNAVANASIRYGGGPVFVDGFEQSYAPLHLESTRPSLVFNELNYNAGAPISADPNSFEDTAGRIGPEIRGNRLLDNSINGIFVRIRTELGKTIEKLSVPARFRNTDAPYVLTENLLIDGGAGGYVEINDGNPATNDLFTRDSGRLQVDPGAVIKLWRSRIELERGRAQFIAEGLPNNRVIFTTLADNRFGAGGTFDTNGANVDVRTIGDWGGIIVNAGAKTSIDRAYIAYGGGETPIEGRFENFSVVETHQGDLRLTNSRLENNAAAVATSDRDGRGGNDASTVFVRGAQPVIIGNDFRSNVGAMVSINANSLVEAENPDWGRSTGGIARFAGYDDNRGPLVRENTLIASLRVILSTTSILPSATVGSTIATMTAAGMATSGTSFQLVDGEGATDNALFTVVGNRLVLAALTAKNTLQVRVRASDASGQRTETPLTLAVEGTFNYAFTNVDAPNADTYLASFTGVRKYNEAFSVGNNYWGPSANGTAGQLVYKFDFPVGTPSRISLKASTPTWDFNNEPGGIGRGASAVEVSKDGLTWVTLHDNLNPLRFTVVSQSWSIDGDLPSAVLGGTSLWLRVKLYAEGAPGGYTTAQFARSTPNATQPVFQLQAFWPTSSKTSTPASFMGMLVRGEEITAESVWDDTDIVHVLQDEIIVQNFHTFTGLRLQSSPNASLVVKLLGANAGFTAAGYGLDIDDRIGGTVQVIGFPTKPVILTSLNDDTVGATYDPLGRLVTDTNADGTATTATPGDWRSLKFLPLSNDRNVAVVQEAEASYLAVATTNNARPTTAQVLGVLAPNFAVMNSAGTMNTWESAQEKTADENRRLGFEVHGSIALDNPRDNDVYAFQGYSGSEVWFDLDKTSSGLDAMLELLDAAGNVIARSVDAQTDASLTPSVIGGALPMEKDSWRGGDYYTVNPRDPGMRAILPTRAGYPIGTLTQYYIRVRSQAAYTSSTTQADYEAGLTATTAAALAAGASKGEYELRIRLRQRDEKPGSTVRSADIRFPTIGIDVLGLPHNSQVLGETAETKVDVNDVWTSAQTTGNLLGIDRNTISIGGELASAADVDWFTFNLDIGETQSIPGVNGGQKTWSVVFDMDYADGFRGDLTIAVFDSTGKLIFMGRDSDVSTDQPGANQGNDFDDLSRGSVGKLDPYIGPIHMPANAGRYYVAVASNEKLPLDLNATFRSDATHTLVRLEPINSLDRIVEDHIGSIGYKDSAKQQINPRTGPLIGTTLRDTAVAAIETTPTTTTTFALTHRNVTADSVNATISYADPLFGTITRWTITTDSSTGAVTIEADGNRLTLAEPLAVTINGPAGKVVVTWKTAVDPTGVQLDKATYLAAGVNPLSAYVTPFSLADVTLFLSTTGEFRTHDAVTGALETTISKDYKGLTIGDLDMRPDGKLYAYVGVTNDTGTVGQVVQLDAGDGRSLAVSRDAIPNAAATGALNFQTTSDTVTALAFGRTDVGEYKDLWLAVRSGGESKLYLAANGGSATTAADATANQGKDSKFGYQGRIGVDLNGDGDYADPRERPLVTGLQFVGDVSGTLYGVTADGRLLRITSGVKSIDETVDFDAPATVVADYLPDLAKVGATGFTAMTAAPQNLYDGALRGKFFALTDTGRLVLINPTASTNKAATFNGTASLLQRTGETGGSIYLTGATSGVVSTKATTSGAVVLSGTTSGTTFTASGTLPNSIRPDMLVTGPGVPYNTTVSSLVGGVVTLSQPVSAATTTADIVFFIQPLSPARAVTAIVNPVDFASATVEVDNVTNIEVGMLAINERLPANTIVTAVDLARGYVTLTNSYSFLVPGSPRMLFVRPDRTELGTLSVGSNTITGITTGDLRVGMAVFGDGLADGARVTNVLGTRIELSAPTTAAGQKTLYFVDGRSVFGIVNSAQIRPGMVVEAGPNIAPNTFVTAVNPSGIVLSQGAIGTASLADLRFFQPVVANVSGTAAGTSITIDTTSLAVGMVAVGPGVPANTTIATLGSGTITLNQALPNGPVTLTFYRDNDGTPVVLDTPTNLSTAGITTGMLVFGAGIASNTTVAGLDQATRTLSLSKPALETINFNELRLVSPALTLAAAIGQGTNILTVSTTIGISVDMVAVGDGIPDGALVTGVNATAKQITLEQFSTRSASNITVRFIKPDIVRDGTGDPFDPTSTTLTIATANLHVGMLVFGNGVPTGTIITAKSAGAVTLSNAVVPGAGRYAFVRDGRVVSSISGTPANPASGMANIAIGQTVAGVAIPAGVTVAAINAADREITVSQSVTAATPSNTLTFTGTGVTNAIVGNLPSTANLSVGMTVIGNGVPPGTTILSIDDNKSITLSAPLTSAGARDLIFVTAGQLSSPAVTRDGTTTNGSAMVTLANVADLRVGMLVRGTNLQPNSVIISRNVAGKTITLSAAATAAGTDALEFINTSSLDYLGDWSGDYNLSPVLAAGATGIAFSPLDINLWHPTERRGDGGLDPVTTADPGHGINAAPDNSRGSTIGGRSMYFGLETWKEKDTAYAIFPGQAGQYGASAADWQRELTNGTGLGDTYNAPGGAYGSLTTDSFSLAGYSYTNKPTLYFNYWLDTEDASGVSNTMRDSARVLISKDGGLTWELIATNNQDRGLRTELPSFASVSSAISYDTRQQVQELFDTGKTSGWRQARIDLGNYANEPDLRLRFDFHTAGEFDPNQADPSGAIQGTANTTGDFNSPERGQRNGHEGFYIDDIIVGFAERGEMVTAAKGGTETSGTTVIDHTSFFDIGTPAPSATVPAQYLMGPYQLEMRRGTEYAVNTSGTKSDIAITQTFDPDVDLIRSLRALGDENLPREQGQFIIEGNWIANAATFGISIDSGDRDPATGAPASGSPRKFSVLNNSRLAPGAVVFNNIVSSSGTAGIRFSGDPNSGNVPLAAVPYGRIVNNTIYGGATQTGIGVQVTENAAPTLLNNLFSNLTTGISVDATSVNDGLGNLRTVIGTSAFHNVATQVSGTTANQSLTLAGNPFVAAGFANFYLSEGTPAIDSSLNMLQDRTEYNVVTSPLGISVSPIVAPDRDIYGQLCGDDPKQASTPGLGSNIFKDRGAVDRIDFAAPYRSLTIPADSMRLTAITQNDTSGTLPPISLAGARGITRLELQLFDNGVGIDDTTVVSAGFVLKRGLSSPQTTLVPGTDYFFSYDPNTNRVTFEAPTVFVPDTYVVEALTRRATLSLPGLLTDLASNTLRPNNDDGTLAFTVTLQDIPSAPLNLRGRVAGADISLTWTAASANGSPITEYVVQQSADGGVTWSPISPPLFNGLTFTATGPGADLFRVAARNALGQGPWSNILDAAPARRPAITLVDDNVAPIIGPVTNGGSTNDTVLVLSGTAAANSIVKIYNGATLLGIASLTGTNWTFTTAALGNGSTLAFTAQAIDGAGDSGLDAAEHTVTIDTAAPSPPSITAVTDDVGSITGVVPDGGTTNDTVLVLSGTAEAGSTVRVFEGTTLLGTATLTGTNWTFTTGALTNGTTYTFKATATDAAGNAGVDSAAYRVTIDTDPPAPPAITSATDNIGAITGTVPNGGITDDTVLVLSGTAVAGSTVRVFNGTTLLGQATLTGTNWTFTTAALTNGVTYEFKATASDTAGNESVASASYTVTIDTTRPLAPVITGIADDVGAITGNVPNGGVTDDTILVLAGTVEAGSVVRVFNGTTLLGQAVLTGTNWTFTTATLTNGTAYAFQATATDTAGNQSDASASYTVTIDTTRPLAPVITGIADDVGSIKGNVPNGGITDDTILVLSGTAVAGSVVRVFNGTTLLGTAALTGTNWTFTTAALTHGVPYAFSATAANAVGSESLPSAAYRVSIDTEAPSVPVITLVNDNVAPVTGTVPNGGRTNDTVLFLSGTAEAGSTVNIFSGSTLLGTTTPTGTTWTFTTSPLLDGTTYAFKATASDRAGNTSAESAPYTVTIDLSPPTVPLIIGFAGGVLSGTTEAGSAVEVIVNDVVIGQATVSGTAWTMNVNVASLPDGTYQAKARATDAAGNASAFSDAFNITIDKTAPAAPVITGLSAGVLSGTAEAGSTVEVFDGDTKLGNATRFGTAWTFAAGTLVDGRTYAFRARAIDAAGNVGTFSTTLSITIDLSPPPRPSITAVTDDVGSITGVVPNGGSTDDTVLILSGTAEAGSTVRVFNGAALLGLATLTGTSWTFTTAVLTGGTTYAFKATATDAAGNTSLESAVYSVTIDTAAPAAPTITAVADDVTPFVGPVASDGVTDDTVLVLSGTVEANATVRIFDGTSLLGTAAVVGTNWSFTTPVLVDGATYAFRAVATDAVGNQSVASVTHSVTIDTSAPTIVEFGSSTPDGFYGPGAQISITATTPGVVRAGSFVVVTLDTGASVRLEASSLSNVLSGVYTVLAGHNSADLTVTAINQALVTDLAGNVMTSAPLPPGRNIADSKAIVVDTAAPVVTGFSSTTPPGTYGIGAVISITATVNEPLRVGSSLTITLNSGASVTLTAASQGTVLSGTYTVAAGQNVGSLAVTGMNAAGVLDRAGNAAGNALPLGNLPFGIAIDTAAPSILRFESTSPDGTYGIGGAINITAVVSEPVQAGATMTVLLNTGAQVTMTALTQGVTLSGTYVVAVGQSAADLGIQSVVGASIRDLAGNEAANTALGIGTLAAARAIVVDGAIRLSTPVGFSSNPSLVPDRRTAVTSIPITFNAPVTGLSLASFKLLLNGRGVSLRGARLTGSGANYTLTIPSRLTNARGIYTLQISAATISATANGAAMAEDQAIYWGKGRSVGFTPARVTATRAPARPAVRTATRR